MDVAIQEAFAGMRANEGGPFGAVIVRDGKIIAKAHNEVLKTHDPTMHAEVNAIRKASKLLQQHHLEGCELYTTCEPCPMCLASAYWARIEKIYYGCTRKDAEDIGFDDNLFYEKIERAINGKEPTLKCVDRTACLGPFKEFKEKIDKEIY